jgi:hypothetical protein
MDPPVRHKQSALKPRAHLQVASAPEPIGIGLSAAVLAVRADEPVVAVVPVQDRARAGDGALPCGPFSPREHATLEAGLRFWVKRNAGIDLGFLQQLCTLGGCDGSSAGVPNGTPVVSVSYLALVGPDQYDDRSGATWRSWYDYFPWEDWRQGKPACLSSEIEPHLKAWADEPCAAHDMAEPPETCDRTRRLRIAFGCDAATWDEEKVLERYDLLCEASLIGEAAASNGHPPSTLQRLPRLSHPTLGNHAQVLASAIGELRRSIKYRPVIFELMPAVFTLFELQKTVEAILGPHLHKQNFRRLVEGCGLVEPTGEYRFRTGGRPAQLFRFRRDVVLERPTPGVRVKAGRG